jgi:nucleotide-binding universal stress UspA family protein
MRVLIAFDGSRGATMALDLARAIPWPNGSVLDLFRVDGSLASSLAEPAATLEREGLTVEQTVERWDSPQEAIVSEAARFGADLVITGSRGHGPMTTALIGSVARGIAEHAPCPVLVARRPTFRSLLFAEDGSPSAFNARHILATWPIFSGRLLHVLSIAQVKTPILAGVVAAVSDDARRAQQDAEMEARSSYGRLAVESAEQLRIAGVAAESEVRSGDPAEEILATAERRGTDVIVLGSRGRDDVQRVMLGSVAREVLLRAHCSVMIVRKS